MRTPVRALDPSPQTYRVLVTVTADDAADAGPVPALFVAVTVNVYVPGARLANVHDVVAEVQVVPLPAPLPLAVTVEPVTAAPPFHGADQDTVAVLAIVLSRIYTLRNQLVRGGATWGGSVNREQLRDCTSLMAKLVPLVVQVMMDHPQALWGDACYPVIA